MTTPSKQDIIEKAFELHHKRNRVSNITPELEELKESGTYEEAKRELMRNDHSYRDYIEQQARELGLIDDKVLVKQTKPMPFTVDLDELMETGLVVTGSSGSGKTFLGFTVVDRLMNNYIIIYVIDPSQKWRLSSVPNRLTITYPMALTFQDGNAKGGKPIRNGTVFDVSFLTYPQRVEFTETFCKWLMDARKKSHRRPRTVVVFEESQLYFYQGSMRSLKRQSNAVELITNGRNFNIRFIAITQFPSMVDKLLIKTTRQRFFGWTSEKNDREYIEETVGEEIGEQLRLLESREFMYSYPRRGHEEAIKIRVPEWKQKPMLVRT